MRVVDANVLLYATNEDAPNHERARRWLSKALAGHEAVGFAWPVLLAFIRLATHPAATRLPLSAETAIRTVGIWLAQPSAVIVEPTTRHLDVLGGLLAEAGTAGNLVGDAHLAAIAVELGATLVSFDRDFGRFAGLRHEVP